MKKLSLLIPSIFLFIILSGFSLSPVNAQSSYNWIRNPSFETLVNYCEDGSFESAGYNNGVTYGNWSGTATFETGLGSPSNYDPNTGDYLLFLAVGTYAWYNLTESYYVLGADIENFTIYFGAITWSYNIYVDIYYTDTTYDRHTTTTPSGYTWAQRVIVGTVDDSKTVKAFKLSGSSAHVVVDDVVISVNDGSGQEEIVYGGANDWQLGQDSRSVAPYFGYLNTEFGRTDSASCQMDTTYESYKIIQDVEYLDTDTIQYIDLWVYGANVSEGEGVKCRLLYGDNSYDEKTVLASEDGSDWENLNFGVSWIDSNKYLKLIYFYSVYDGEVIEDGATFNIDDVGLWSDLPYGYHKFVFTISPTPLSKGSYSFDAYSNNIYTFTGYFYNITDLSLSINGTYQISDVYGLHTGNMTNGVFSLSLSARTFGASPYTLETISVTVITENEIFNVDITAYWYPTGGSVEPTEVDSDLITNFMIVGLLLFAPSVTIGYLGMQINPTMGIITFIGGLTLMGAICLQINVINIWFMFAILIIDTIIVLGLLKTGRIG